MGLLSKYGNALYAFRESLYNNSGYLFKGVSKEDTNTNQFRQRHFSYLFVVDVSGHTLEIVEESKDTVIFGIPLKSIAVKDLKDMNTEIAITAPVDIVFTTRDDIMPAMKSNTHLILCRYNFTSKVLYSYTTGKEEKFSKDSFNLMDHTTFKGKVILDSTYPFKSFINATVDGKLAT